MVRSWTTVCILLFVWCGAVTFGKADTDTNDITKLKKAVAPASNAVLQTNTKRAVGSKRRMRPHDCADLKSLGIRSSGVYTVHTGECDALPVKVYCDMETDGGGWLVFQRRQDGSENFYRNWKDYARGFGKLTKEFWLGNDNIHYLTAGKRYVLRIDLADFSGNKRFAIYTNFKMGSAHDKYKLSSLGKYYGNAGDSLSYQLGYKFSTMDQDNDVWPKSCAVTFKGAWWYRFCHHSNLNGKYLEGKHKSYADGVNWREWMGHHYSLRFTEMKIRPCDL